MLDSYYRAFIAEQRYLMYLDGLKMTLLVSLLAIILGVALGTILALMRMTAERRGKSTLLSKIAYVYIDIIRGTPTVTQLLIMYFVVLKGVDGLIVGTVTFGLNSVCRRNHQGRNPCSRSWTDGRRTLSGPVLWTNNERYHPSAGGKKYSSRIGK